jgi:hypothetical protein
MTSETPFVPHLTDTDIEEFAKLYKEEFGTDLEPDEHDQEGRNCITQVRLSVPK